VLYHLLVAMRALTSMGARWVIPHQALFGRPYKLEDGRTLFSALDMWSQVADRQFVKAGHSFCRWDNLLLYGFMARPGQSFANCPAA
jgi:hypothetical protein